jgi:ABC-2 type transport system permease protein
MSTREPLPSSRAITLIARRELDTRLRTRSFVISTAVTLALLMGYVLLQGMLTGAANTSKVALTGQATSFARPLIDSGARLGFQVEIKEVANAAEGERLVRDDELDALVSGAPAAPNVIVRDRIQPELHSLLNGLVQQQVLAGWLAERAAESGDPALDPNAVLTTVFSAGARVIALEPRDANYGQRLAVGLAVGLLLYFSLVVYGQMVAQGVVEEKSSRVVELLLATVQPWQLLAGKVIGLGLVGLIQFAIIAVVGLVTAIATGVLTVSAVAAGTVIWGLIWYLLGYFLYATVFAAAGSLVSRQEDAQAVLTPVLMVIAIGFVIGFNVLVSAPTSAGALVLSLLPPFAPLLMPGRIALGGVAAWEIATAIVLIIAAIVALTWLGGRIYQNAVLRSGSRVPLRDALRLR